MIAFPRIGAITAAAALSLLSISPALAQAPSVNKGDTAFLMVCTILVLLMTIDRKSVV